MVKMGYGHGDARIGPWRLLDRVMVVMGIYKRKISLVASSQLTTCTSIR